MLSSRILVGARRAIHARHVRRAFHADVLPNLVSTASPEFASKASAMSALQDELNAHITTARAGGGPKAQERMVSRGKMLPRERFVSYL